MKSNAMKKPGCAPHAGVPDLGAAAAGPRAVSTSGGAATLEELLAAGNPWRPRSTPHPAKPAQGANPTKPASGVQSHSAPATSAASKGMSSLKQSNSHLVASINTPGVPPGGAVPGVAQQHQQPPPTSIGADWGDRQQPAAASPVALQPASKDARQITPVSKPAMVEVSAGGQEAPVLTCAALQLLHGLRDYCELARSAIWLCIALASWSVSMAYPLDSDKLSTSHGKRGSTDKARP